MALGIYSRVAFNTVGGLVVAASASVEVRREDTGALATIFSDRAGGSGLANPFTADAEGRFEFYAAGIDKGYQVKITKGAEIKTFNNQVVGLLGERDPVEKLFTAKIGGAAIDEEIFFDGLVFDDDVDIKRVDLYAREAPVGADFSLEFLKNIVPTGAIATLPDGSNKKTNAISGLSYPLIGYLSLPGIPGNFAEAPGDADLVNITGDIDLRGECALDDWTPSVRQPLISKWVNATPDRSYSLLINSSGGIQLNHSTDGTLVTTTDSTVATGFVNGSRHWIRATMDVNNGAAGFDVKFYTSVDGVIWTQLGTTVTTGGVTSIFPGIAILEIGTRNAGAGGLLFTGKVYRTQILNGIDGIVAFDAVFRQQDAGVSLFKDSGSIGLNVTINTSGGGEIAKIIRDTDELGLKVKSVGSTTEGSEIDVVVHYEPVAAN